MALARHGRGPLAVTRAFASQIHPVFMLPAVATAVFGAVLAGPARPVAGTLHVVAVFLALYTAHVTDGLVDFHVRGEDADHPLTRRGCHVARIGASLGFGICLVGLAVAVDLVAVALTAPGWLIAIHHAPELDTTPLGATLGYPAGIALALLGGYYVHAGTLAATPVALAAVFLVVLAGVKVVDDTADYRYDRSIEKRTVAVAVGPRRAIQLGYVLMGVGMASIIAFVPVLPGVPPSAGLSVIAFGAVATIAWRADPELATKLLVRGSYLYLAALVWAVWFRPLG